MKVAPAYLTLVFFLLLQPLQVKGQEDAIRWKVERHDLLRLGLGIDAEIMQGNALCPKAEMRLGGPHLKINAFTGCKLSYWNSVNFPRREEYLSAFYFPVYAGAAWNIMSIGQGTLYLRGDVAYNIAGNMRYHIKGYTTDAFNEFTKSFHEVCGKVGYTFPTVSVALYCKFDIQSGYRQKDIYDDPMFNYDALARQLNERFRIGISVIKYIRL